MEAAVSGGRAEAAAFSSRKAMSPHRRGAAVGAAVEARTARVHRRAAAAGGRGQRRWRSTSPRRTRRTLPPPPPASGATAESAHFSFSREGRRSKEGRSPPPTLRNLDVTFAGQLTMVAGAVGSGKSSMLRAARRCRRRRAVVVGRRRFGRGQAGCRRLCQRRAGGSRLRGQAGYFSQTPFILNDTLRGNILLGALMDDVVYQRTLYALPRTSRFCRAAT